MRDGDRRYPVDKFIFHHAVTPFWANESDQFLIDWFSNNGINRTYSGGAINPEHTKPGTNQLSYSNAHAALREYTLDGNKYGWRWTWLIDDPYNNVTWGAANWPVNQTCINLETCGNYLNQLLPDKALMLCADVMRPHDAAIGGVLKTFGHKEVSQTGTACPGRIVEQIDKFVEMLNNPGKWNEILWPTPTQPTPSPTPTPPKPTAPAKSTYTLNKSADGATKPRDMIIKKATKLWNLDSTAWGDFKAVKDFSPGQPFTVVGYAKHPLGGTYGMTAHSFGNAADDGTPSFNNGVNMADLEDMPAPAPAPKPGDVIQPPTPTPAPVEPTPTPAPEPTPPTPPEGNPAPAPAPETPTPTRPPVQYEEPKKPNQMNILQQLYSFIVLGNQKAVVAFFVTGAAAILGAWGVSMDMTVGDALTLLFTSVFGSLLVYLKRNQK